MSQIACISSPHSASTAERFWAKVNRSKPDECWSWMAFRDPNGYGRITVTTPGCPRSYLAHRMSWELEHGMHVPLGLDVLHSCDYPPCVNPAHLSAGTHRENVQQSVVRGRRCRGDKSHKSVLTEALVRELRTHPQAKTPSVLADERGLPRRAVSNAIVGFTYRWMNAECPPVSVGHRGEANGASKLNDEAVREIRALLAAGALQYVIAQKFGVSDITIQYIRAGKIWNHVK